MYPMRFQNEKATVRSRSGFYNKPIKAMLKLGNKIMHNEYDNLLARLHPPNFLRQNNYPYIHFCIIIVLLLVHYITYHNYIERIICRIEKLQRKTSHIPYMLRSTDCMYNVHISCLITCRRPPLTTRK